MTAFSIPKKMFLKIESLMYALRAHVNRTLYIYIYIYSYFIVSHNFFNNLNIEKKMHDHLKIMYQRLEHFQHTLQTSFRD